MEESPSSKKLYCAYKGPSDPWENESINSGQSPSTAGRLSNKLREARIKRQYMRSGSMSSEVKMGEEGPVFVWEEEPLTSQEKGQGSEEESKSGSRLVREGGAKPSSNKNNYSSDRGIKLHQLRSDKRPVYEILALEKEDRDEVQKETENDDKYLAYSQQNVKKESKTFTKKNSNLPTKSRIFSRKPSDHVKVSVKVSKESIREMAKKIEENLSEAEFYMTVAREVMEKKDENYYSAHRFEQFSDTNEKERSSDRLKPSHPVADPSSDINTMGGEGKEKNENPLLLKTKSSNSSVVRRVLTMKSKREPSNYTMLF